MGGREGGTEGGGRVGGRAERLDSLGVALHRPPSSRQKGQGTLGGGSVQRDKQDLWRVRENESHSRERRPTVPSIWRTEGAN